MDDDLWDILPAGVTSDSPRKVQFARLPFVAVPRASGQPVPLAGASYSEDALFVLQGLDWLLDRHLDVVNLSLEAGPRRFDPGEPLQVATRMLHEMGTVVVVAAGNSGPREDSLQGLARSPWVVSVGATDSSRQLLRSSSRGPAEPSAGPAAVDEPDDVRVKVARGPLVVSDGTDYGDRPFPPGTSFAAPKVARACAWLRSALRLSFDGLGAQQRGEWRSLSGPIPFPTLGFADTGAQEETFHQWSELAASFLDRGTTEVAVSRGQAERDWYRDVTATIAAAGVRLDLSITPVGLRHGLEMAAEPIEGAPQAYVGAGYLTDDQMRHFLGSITPTRWLQMLSGGHALDEELIRRLSELDQRLGPLWDPKTVETTEQLFRHGIRVSVCKVTH